MMPPGIAGLQPGSSVTPEPGAPGAPGIAGLQPGPVGPTWHSRGYLPHFDAPHAIQHVTYHLADSLPADVLARLEETLRELAPQRIEAERRRRIEAWLNAGHGSCVLRVPAIASMVQASFLHFDGERYRLLAWVVMPNHVHVLFELLDSWTVARIVASWKSFTGRPIAANMEESHVGAWRSQEGGRVWQREYWDRFIRDERHLHTVLSYIHENPVKAGLAAKAEDWQWSSARLWPGTAGIAALQRGESARLEPGDPSGPTPSPPTAP